MPSFLTDSEVSLITEISENGAACMTGRKFAELTLLAHRFGATALTRDYHLIRIKLVDGKWYGIADDELQLFAMELLRLGNA